jgi:TatA/E family protein of Tat protein translocase
VLSQFASQLPVAFGPGDVGSGEIIVIGIVALLLFGKNLPKQARNIGKAIAEFKRTLNDASSEIHREMDAAAEGMEEAAKDVGNEIAKDNPLQDVQQAVAGDNPSPAASPVASDTAPAPGTPITESATATATATPAAAAEAPAPQTAKAVSNPAALDDLLRNIPPPTNVPPPLV